MSNDNIENTKKKPMKQPNNPLHGVTLKDIMQTLREHYSWKELNQRIQLNCFFSHPSIKSSLTFLRKNDWARKQVEELYLELVKELESYKKDPERPIGEL